MDGRGTDQVQHPTPSPKLPSRTAPALVDLFSPEPRQMIHINIATASASVRVDMDVESARGDGRGND